MAPLLMSEESRIPIGEAGDMISILDGGRAAEGIILVARMRRVRERKGRHCHLSHKFLKNIDSVSVAGRILMGCWSQASWTPSCYYNC